MDDVFMAFVVLGTIAYGIVSIIKSITDFKLKKKLIDKATANEGISAALSDSIKSLSEKEEQSKYPSLKWGLICFFGGVGLISIEYLQFDYHRSSLPYGIILTSIALGFLLYYFLVKREASK